MPWRCPTGLGPRSPCSSSASRSSSTPTRRTKSPPARCRWQQAANRSASTRALASSSGRPPRTGRCASPPAHATIRCSSTPGRSPPVPMPSLPSRTTGQYTWAALTPTSTRRGTQPGSSAAPTMRYSRSPCLASWSWVAATSLASRSAVVAARSAGPTDSTGSASPSGERTAQRRRAKRCSTGPMRNGTNQRDLPLASISRTGLKAWASAVATAAATSAKRRDRNSTAASRPATKRQLVPPTRAPLLWPGPWRLKSHVSTPRRGGPTRAANEAFPRACI
mmetsp:Transcript_61909/g.191834  ORF Transcript_61909/g.191834 Transcript_61909/m.191834 type:complete len:279 (+) Transcript_61909:1768-2604(+)